MVLPGEVRFAGAGAAEAARRETVRQWSSDRLTHQDPFRGQAKVSPHRAVAKYQGFQKGITGQAIRAVDSRAGAFTARVQAGQRCLAPDVGSNTPHEVVGRGSDWNRVATEIEAKFLAHSGDGGKSLAQMLGPEVGDVEIRGQIAGSAHFEDDRPRHDVAGSQVTALVVARA